MNNKIDMGLKIYLIYNKEVKHAHIHMESL